MSILFDITRTSGTGTFTTVGGTTWYEEVGTNVTSTFHLTPQTSTSGTFSLTGTITLNSEYTAGFVWYTGDYRGAATAVATATIKQTGVDLVTPMSGPALSSYIVSQEDSGVLTNTIPINITGLTSSADIIIEIITVTDRYAFSYARPPEDPGPIVHDFVLARADATSVDIILNATGGGGAVPAITSFVSSADTVVYSATFTVTGVFAGDLGTVTNSFNADAPTLTSGVPLTLTAPASTETSRIYTLTVTGTGGSPVTATKTVSFIAGGGSGGGSWILSQDYIAPTYPQSKKLYSAQLFNSLLADYPRLAGVPSVVSYLVTDPSGHANKIPYATLPPTHVGTGTDAPLISSYPSGTITTFVGHDLVLSYAATGTEPLTFKYFKNDPTGVGPGFWTDPAPTTGHYSTLTETNRQVIDSGDTYFLRVSNAYGSVDSVPVTSNVTTLVRTWPITITLIPDPLIGGASSLVSEASAYDEQALSVAPGAEVASYITAGEFNYANLTGASPGGYNTWPSVPGGYYIQPFTCTQTDYTVFTFAAGSLVNPVVTIVYDAVATTSWIHTETIMGDGAALMGGDYGGSAHIRVEASTNSGSTWAPIDYIVNIMTDFHAGIPGTITDTVAKTVTTHALTGTINTGTLQIRLVAETVNLSIWDHSSFGTYETMACDNSSASANIYALYLQTS